MKKKNVILSILIIFFLFSITDKVYASWMPLKQDYNENSILVINNSMVYDKTGTIIGYANQSTYFNEVNIIGEYYYIKINNTYGYIPVNNCIKGNYIYEYLCFENRLLCKYVCFDEGDIILVNDFDYETIIGISLKTGETVAISSYDNIVYPIFANPIYNE